MVVKLDRVRYLMVEFLNRPPPISQFVSMLRKIVSNLKGELFLASSALHVIEFAQEFAIVKCTNKSRDTVEAAIQLIQYDSFIPVIRKVSGTLKSLSKTAIDKNDN